MSEFKYIVVDGVVKSGKTRLAEILAQEFNSRLILDNKDNPFLNEYYVSISGTDHSLGLKTQLIFLLNRYSQQLEIGQKGLIETFRKGCVFSDVFGQQVRVQIEG